MTFIYATIISHQHWYKQNFLKIKQTTEQHKAIIVLFRWTLKGCSILHCPNLSNYWLGQLSLSSLQGQQMSSRLQLDVSYLS